MNNLSIIAACNRHCPYCFATETLAKLRSPEKIMRWETFERSLDFLERSGIEQVGVLGGEPTLHPEFPRMVDRILERNFNLLLFSGGLMPEVALRRLERVAPDCFSVLINVLSPDEGRPSEHRRQAQVFRRIGSRVQLGFTIGSPNDELDFLLDLIEDYGLLRRIRLGLAHPILGGSNHSLHPEHYMEVGRLVGRFGRRAWQRDPGLGFVLDCGFVPCMFPKDFLEALPESKPGFAQSCSPIIDILPDGRVISCYGLAHHHQEPLPAKDDAAWLRSRFMEVQEPDRSNWLYPRCGSCQRRRNGGCSGGCLAQRKAMVEIGEQRLSGRRAGVRLPAESS